MHWTPLQNDTTTSNTGAAAADWDGVTRLLLAATDPEQSPPALVNKNSVVGRDHESDGDGTAGGGKDGEVDGDCRATGGGGKDGEDDGGDGTTGGGMDGEVNGDGATGGWWQG